MSAHAIGTIEVVAMAHGHFCTAAAEYDMAYDRCAIKYNSKSSKSSNTATTTTERGEETEHMKSYNIVTTAG